MRISYERYQQLMEFFGHITPKSGVPSQDQLTVCHALRGGGSTEPEFFGDIYAAGQALQRLVQGFRGPVELAQLANALAPRNSLGLAALSHSAYIPPDPKKFFEQSAELQGLKYTYCSNVSTLIDKLREIRPQIVREQFPESEPERATFAMTSLVQAMIAEKRTKAGRDAAFLYLAGIHDIFDFSPTLQGLQPEHFKTPEALLEKLFELRPAIVREIKQVSRVNPSFFKHLTFGKLVKALVAGGYIKGKSTQFKHIARLRDIFEASKILQDITDRELSSPEILIPRLAKLRPKIVRELKNQPRPPRSKQITTYSLGILVQALIAGGRITENPQNFERQATAYDFFLRSPTLQTLPKTALATPAALRAALLKRLEKIREEQQQWHKRLYPHGTCEDFSPTPTLQRLISALYAGGMLKARSPYSKHVLGIRIFNNSPTLRSIQEKYLTDKRSFFLGLIPLRDQVAVQDLKARGKLPQDAFTFPGAEDYYSVATIVSALIAGNIIPPEEAATFENYAIFVNYTVKLRAVIEPELHRLLKLGNGHIHMQDVNRSIFVRLRDIGTQNATQKPLVLCDRNIKAVLSKARIFLDHPYFSPRSLFDGAELAYYGIFSDKTLKNEPIVADLESPEKLAEARHSQLIPEPLMLKLLSAAQIAKTEPKAARKKAVESLQELSAHYNAQETIPPEAETYLGGIKCLTGWNIDALGNPAVTPSFLPLASLLPLPAPIIAIP